jgi:catechol 2,3-dioxygenase-like lactoylglutathione lyase family enzyme
MIRGIHHPCVSTGDMARALGFYRDLLGFEEVFSFGWEAGTEMADLADAITGLRGSSANACLLRAGNAFLEIFAFSQPPSTRGPAQALSDHGISHICLDVDDAHAEHARLSAAGVTFQSAPIDVGPMRVAYCRDPDGNVVELQQITDPASPMALRAS